MADISLRPAAETKASPWCATGLTVVRVTLGVILLSASGLKLLSWGDDSGLGSSLALLYDPFWRMAAVEVEALLGLWLLVGLWPRALWWSALLWFLLLSGTSFYLGLVGQPSCGCFGAKLPVSPWYAFGLDVAAVAALVLFRPTQVWRFDPAVTRRILLTAAGAVAILAGAAGVLTWAYGSPREAILRFRGELITVEPPLVDMGDVHDPDTRSTVVRLANHSDQPVRVIGGTADCSCVAWDDLPVVVAPHSDQSITIRVTFRGSPKVLQHAFALFTDDASQPRIFGEVRGRLVSKTGP